MANQLGGIEYNFRCLKWFFSKLPRRLWSVGMVDRRKMFSLISSRDLCQRSSPLRISDTTRAGFEPAENLSLGFVKWSCALVITTTPLRHWYVQKPVIFRTRSIISTLVYFKLEAYPEQCQTSTVERFAKIVSPLAYIFLEMKVSWLTFPLYFRNQHLKLQK